jgi:hypothetical protein
MGIKQTAVEWLVKTINEKVDIIPMDKWDEIRGIIQQAKEMEKEQIKQSYLDGFIEAYDFPRKKTADQYYKEKFVS